MPKHIRNLRIDAYKGIQNLLLSDLTTVNILTGDNNSGKTSILELIRTIERPEHLPVWLSATRVQSIHLGDSAFFEGIVNLFPIKQEKKRVLFSYEGFSSKVTHVKIEGESFQEQLSEDEILKINRVSHARKKDEGEQKYQVVQGLHLKFYKNNQCIQEDDFFDFQIRYRSCLYRSSTVYLSPYAQEDYAQYLDDLFTSSEYYKEMIQLLKIFDSDIIGLTATGNEEYSRPVRYLIQSHRCDQALPLSFYGDGMKKAVCLLAGLIKAKDGILLVDDFEIGIHTSAMDKIFSILLEGAKRLNVQVFLTSHSKEAINKILRVSPEMQDDMNLYTLYRYDGKNLVRCMTAKEAIHAGDNLGLELR